MYHHSYKIDKLYHMVLHMRKKYRIAKRRSTGAGIQIICPNSVHGDCRKANLSQKMAFMRYKIQK